MNDSLVCVEIHEDFIQTDECMYVNLFPLYLFKPDGSFCIRNVLVTNLIKYILVIPEVYPSNRICCLLTIVDGVLCLFRKDEC